VIRIGTQGTQKFTQIAGIYNTKVTGGEAVVVNSKGQLGVTTIKLATTDDTLSLRAEIAGLRNELRQMQAEIAELRKAH
jgi:hypothetical protein